MFDTAMFKKCHAISASMNPIPTVVFEMEVLPIVANGGGNLFDMFASISSFANTIPVTEEQ